MISLLVLLLGAIVAHKLETANAAFAAAETDSPAAPAQQPEPAADAGDLPSEFQLTLPAAKQSAPTRPAPSASAVSTDPFAPGAARRGEPNRPPQGISGNEEDGTPAWARSAANGAADTGATRFRRTLPIEGAPGVISSQHPAPSAPRHISQTTAKPLAVAAAESDPFAAPAGRPGSLDTANDAAPQLPVVAPSIGGQQSLQFEPPVRPVEHQQAGSLFGLTEPTPPPATTTSSSFTPVDIGAGTIPVPAPEAVPAPARDSWPTEEPQPAPWSFDSAEPASTPMPVEPAPLLTPEPNPFAEPPRAAPAPIATAATGPDQHARPDRIHAVAPGDNYWTISRQHYGSARYFAALAEYNRQRIPRPERMKPGMKVLIPDLTLLEQRYPRLTGQPEVKQLPPGVPEQGFFVDANGQPMYRVGKGDTLTDIAQTHLGRLTRWNEIYVMNREQLTDPNTLKLGMILRLPRDASRVTLAPDGAAIR